MSSMNREQVEGLVVRLLYSLLLLLLLRLSWLLLLALAVMQYLYRVLNDNQPHQSLSAFSAEFASWYQQATAYVMGSADSKAWPLADWPVQPVADNESQAVNDA